MLLYWGTLPARVLTKHITFVRHCKINHHIVFVAGMTSEPRKLPYSNSEQLLQSFTASLTKLIILSVHAMSWQRFFFFFFFLRLQFHGKRAALRDGWHSGMCQALSAELTQFSFFNTNHLLCFTPIPQHQKSRLTNTK